jgi:hypothetical protein
MAIGALTALLVAPSYASATSPTLCETSGGTCSNLATGTKFLATNVEHSGTSRKFITQSNLGNMECETATVTGEIVKNSEAQVVGTISTFEVKGTAGNPSSSHCAGGYGGQITVTPNHTTNPTHNGVASLPWCITFGAEDRFTIFGEMGGSCTSGQTRPTTIVYDSSTLGACTYEKKEPVVGTYTTHPADAILTINGQTFTKIAGSVFCPASFNLFLALTLATDVSEASGAALYLK